MWNWFHDFKLTRWNKSKYTFLAKPLVSKPFSVSANGIRHNLDEACSSSMMIVIIKMKHFHRRYAEVISYVWYSFNTLVSWKLFYGSKMWDLILHANKRMKEWKWTISKYNLQRRVQRIALKKFWNYISISPTRVYLAAHNKQQQSTLAFFTDRYKRVCPEKMNRSLNCFACETRSLFLLPLHL